MSFTLPFSTSSRNSWPMSSLNCFVNVQIVQWRHHERNRGSSSLHRPHFHSRTRATKLTMKMSNCPTICILRADVSSHFTTATILWSPTRQRVTIRIIGQRMDHETLHTMLYLQYMYIREVRFRISSCYVTVHNSRSISSLFLIRIDCPLLSQCIPYNTSHVSG